MARGGGGAGGLPKTCGTSAADVFWCQTRAPQHRRPSEACPGAPLVVGRPGLAWGEGARGGGKGGERRVGETERRRRKGRERAARTHGATGRPGYHWGGPSREAATTTTTTGGEGGGGPAGPGQGPPEGPAAPAHPASRPPPPPPAPASRTARVPRCPLGVPARRTRASEGPARRVRPRSCLRGGAPRAVMRGVGRLRGGQGHTASAGARGTACEGCGAVCYQRHCVGQWGSVLSPPRRVLSHSTVGVRAIAR